MSGGVATFPDDAGDLEQLIKRADEGLYRSKAEGKNRVTVIGGERRQHPRVSVAHRVTVRADGPAAAGRAKNVCGGGPAARLVRTPGPGGDALDLTLRPRGRDPVGVRGEVVRVGRRTDRRDACSTTSACASWPSRAACNLPRSCAAPDLRRLRPDERARAAYNGIVRAPPGPTALILILSTTGRAAAPRAPPATQPSAPEPASLPISRARPAAAGTPLVRDNIVSRGSRRTRRGRCYRAIVLRPGGRLKRDHAILRLRPRAALSRRVVAGGARPARPGIRIAAC